MLKAIILSRLIFTLEYNNYYKEVMKMTKNKTTSLTIIEDSTLEETQLAEQLYNSAGLGPVVDAGLHDYDKHIQVENKLINKMLGPRETDIRGYGEAVAKRVATAVYSQLSRQYGGKVGDLRSYIMTLEEERDRANFRYDELMGRAIGILGEEHSALRSDSKEFMDKLTNVMGEDLKVSRINSEAITEKLADIDGLRSEIRTLTQDKELLADTSAKEKEQLKVRYESQIAEADNRHKAEVKGLNEKYESQIGTINNQHKAEIKDLKEKHGLQIAEVDNQHRAEVKDLNSRINALAKDKELLADASAKEKEQLKVRYEQQIAEADNQHRAEVKDLNSQMNALVKEKELLADTSAKEKEQLKERYETQITEADNQHTAEVKELNEKHESQIAEADNQHKAEVRNLNEKHESQIAEADNQHRAEVKDLNLRINALAKEKELLADTSAKEKERKKSS